MLVHLGQFTTCCAESFLATAAGSQSFRQGVGDSFELVDQHAGLCLRDRIDRSSRWDHTCHRRFLERSPLLRTITAQWATRRACRQDGRTRATPPGELERHARSLVSRIEHEGSPQS